MSAKFCSQCGTRQDNEAARFCKSCGATLGSSVLASPQPPAAGTAATPPPPPPPMSGEKVLAAVPVSLKENMVLLKPYILLITAERVILVKKSKEMYERIARQAEADAQAGGKGFFGRMKEKLVQTVRMYEKFFDLPPEVILAENPDSLVLLNNSISEIKYRKSRYEQDKDGSMKLENGMMVISAAGQKYKLTLEAIAEERDLKDLLTDIFGHRVKGGFIIG